VNRLLFGTAVMAMTMTYGISAANASPPPLGLPPVPIPADNPQTPAKIALGNKLFHDARFSSTGTISCASCHADAKAFTDHLPVAEGVHKLKGTRNTPTIINAAYFHLLFWDGREPSLEAQAKDPMVNPVEMGLKNHEPVLKIVRTDPVYQAMFKQVFGVTGNQVTMKQVLMAIGSFERNVVPEAAPLIVTSMAATKKPCRRPPSRACLFSRTRAAVWTVTP